MHAMHASTTWARRLARPLARLGTLPGRGPAWQPPQGTFIVKSQLTGIDIPDTQGFARHNAIIPRIKFLVGVVEKQDSSATHRGRPPPDRKSVV